MQRLLLILALVAMTAGCSKKDASTDNATGATAAATAAASDAAGSAASAAAAAATIAADASAAAVSASTAAATAAAAAASPADSAAITNTTMVSPTPAAGGSGNPATIDLPVYPGATKDPKTSLAISSGTGSVKLDVYLSKDSSATVAAWYKSHVPANWQNAQLESNGKTTATFSTPEHSGDDNQSIITTGLDDGTTRIQLTTKTGH